jgi:hypothetical protein
LECKTEAVKLVTEQGLSQEEDEVLAVPDASETANLATRSRPGFEVAGLVEVGKLDISEGGSGETHGKREDAGIQ